jgi:hypothetical protein
MCKPLFILILLILGGCGTLTNQYPAGSMAERRLPGGAGRIILSTGAPAKCQSMATYLKLLPEPGTLPDKQVALVSIDSSALKSDYADHQGNLHVIPVPQGRYYFVPWVNSLVVRTVLQPKATFSVTAGETVYLGEYFMPSACALETLYEIHDQMDRDMALLKAKDPQFDTSRVVKRLMMLEGGVPACDATNNTLTCR